MDGIIPPNLLACLGRTDKSGVTDSFIAASAGEGKSRKSLDHVLLRIFAPKTKVTIRPRTLTAATIPRTAGMPNLPFKIGRTKTPKRSDLRDASSEAASSSNVSRCGGVTSANASVSRYGSIFPRRSLPDDTCGEFRLNSRSALEIAYPFLPSCGQ